MVGLSERFAICELKGGLGNQLFQYAAARALCLREQRALYLAFRQHRGDTPRSFMLHHYRLEQHAPRLGELTLRRIGLRSPLLGRDAGRLWRLLHPRLERIREPSFRYHPLRGSSDRVALDGYFQSPRHFSDHAARIREDLTLEHPLPPARLALLRQIEDCQAVALHVRRGDYVANPSAAAFHGVLGLDYYHAALAHLGSAADGATLFVFSDDPAWARAQLAFGRPTVIVEPSQPDHPWEDLKLMSACRHFVIANSSFSWWGAWLATHQGKRVIAPARWFADARQDTSDLCPPDWIRL